MTDQQIATHIFVSHSSADSAFVQRLAADLQRVGVPIWVDHQKLKPGTRNWEKAIREALKKSRALIYVASVTARESDYVQDELSIAAMENCTLLAAWAAGEDSRWLDCAPLGYGKLQYTDMRDDKYQEGLKELLDALTTVPTRIILMMPFVEEETAPTSAFPKSSKPIEQPPLDETIQRNPYKALDAFTEADAKDFFGRNDMVTALSKRMSDFPAFLAVIGASGSGKSSVVMAGLIPALRNDHPNWVILPPIKPGPHPMEALAIMLYNAHFQQGSINAVSEDLNDSDSRGLIKRAAAIPRAPKGRVVLLVDQFEEVFTQTTNEHEREHFINILTSAATDPGSIVTVILTLRADFFDRPLSDSQLGKLIQTHSESILPMSITDMKQTIEAPAKLAGLSFEDGLVSDIVFDTRGQVGGLPLLQYTLEQLVRQCDGSTLTRQAYQVMGGVKGALAQRAEETYTTLAMDEHRHLAQALFLRLIEPNTMEQETTRRRAALSELDLPAPAQTKIIHQCADTFVDARLLTTNETAGIKTIEVSHEALIREWKRLGDWLHEARDDIRLQQAISQDAAAWQRHGQRPEDLYWGQKLSEAQSWAARNVSSAEEASFIKSSQHEEAAQIAHEERRARQIQNLERAAAAAAICAALAVIGIIAAILAAIGASGQIANASIQLGTATVAQGQAVATGNGANTRVAIAGATLTPIEPTLTAVAGNLNTALAQQSTIQFNSTVSVFDQNRLSTLVPILAQVPPTYAPTLSWQQKLTTATAIAAAAQWTPQSTKDAKSIEMVVVPAGCFLMGYAGFSDSAPVTEICFDKPFWIDRYDVTNKAFSDFVAAGGYKDNKYWTFKGFVSIGSRQTWAGDKNGSSPNHDCLNASNDDQQPVVCVTWYEAYAYCQWRGNNTQLPTEAQWEYAARGPFSLSYPWGNNFDPTNDADKAIYWDNTHGQIPPAIVGSKPAGKSWVGAYDMAGNVWQWVDGIYKSYPYADDDRNSVPSLNSNNSRVLRGGSRGVSSTVLRSAYRYYIGDPTEVNINYGFRCARS